MMVLPEGSRRFRLDSGGFEAESPHLSGNAPPDAHSHRWQRPGEDPSGCGVNNPVNESGIAVIPMTLPAYRHHNL